MFGSKSYWVSFILPCVPAFIDLIKTAFLTTQCMNAVKAKDQKGKKVVMLGGPNLFICSLIMFLNRVFRQEWFNRCLHFLASLIKNGRTLRKCYLFSYRYKNIWDIGICLKPHFCEKCQWFRNLKTDFSLTLANKPRSSLVLYLQVWSQSWPYNSLQK